MEKTKLVIKSNVDQYIKKVKKAANEDFNQKIAKISFKKSELRMYDSFYDKRPK